MRIVTFNFPPFSIKYIFVDYTESWIGKERKWKTTARQIRYRVWDLIQWELLLPECVLEAESASYLKRVCYKTENSEKMNFCWFESFVMFKVQDFTIFVFYFFGKHEIISLFRGSYILDRW